MWARFLNQILINGVRFQHTPTQTSMKLHLWDLRLHGCSLATGIILYTLLQVILKSKPLKRLDDATKFPVVVRSTYPIWFILAIKSNSMEEAILTRLAQSIFPVHDFTTLVLIVEAESVQESLQDTLLEHIQRLDTILMRFGISYVLLHSRMYQELKRINNSDSESARMTSARQTGLIWALEYAQEGVVVLGHADFAYDYHVFHEIQHTTKISTWPVGFYGPLGVSTAIVSEGRVTGQHTGDVYLQGEMRFDLASFAINLAYIRNEMETEHLWKITFDGGYTTRSVAIPLEHIQPLATDCTRILVWRSRTYVMKFPEKIKNLEIWGGTNVEVLLKSLLGRRYQALKNG